MSDELHFQRATGRPDLLARPVVAVLAAAVHGAGEVEVAEIDPEAAETDTFCRRYGVAPDESANTVVVSARRGGHTRLAACVVLSTTRADVNGVVRRHLGARKASFASVDVVMAETGMEYGGITPLGLPADWPLLVDTAVAKASTVVAGSGLRCSKLRMPGRLVTAQPNVTVLDDLGRG